MSSFTSSELPSLEIAFSTFLAPFSMCRILSYSFLEALSCLSFCLRAVTSFLCVSLLASSALEKLYWRLGWEGASRFLGGSFPSKKASRSEGSAKVYAAELSGVASEPPLCLIMPSRSQTSVATSVIRIQSYILPPVATPFKVIVSWVPVATQL